MEAHQEDHRVLPIDHRVALVDHQVLRTVLREVQDHQVGVPDRRAEVQDHLVVQVKDLQEEDKLITENGICPPFIIKRTLLFL